MPTAPHLKSKPLNEAMKKDEEFSAEDFVPTFLQLGKLNEKLYGLPVYRTTQVMRAGNINSTIIGTILALRQYKPPPNPNNYTFQNK
ncbi:hypothetical protein [Metabacillus arenae]|uniref:Uncharacterized protein n=1 Tax=Metabacillus arenae TaxID=2771434 RepID=A0A926NJI2_9BACI|nr:hypothetical protein [Metabacillus arenae]MBD1382225.1 hypothetical protein [Metabacillus arenae]